MQHERNMFPVADNAIFEIEQSDDRYDVWLVTGMWRYKYLRHYCYMYIPEYRDINKISSKHCSFSDLRC